MTVRTFAHEVLRASIGLVAVVGVGAVLPIAIVALIAQAV